jgi:recombination protein RecT
MSKREVDEIRARSKSGGSGPWVTDYEEMAKKSVFRRHSKVLPMSAELVQAMEADGESLQLDVPAPANRFEDAKQAEATVRPTITPALCVELAKALPEALVLDLMAKYQIHAVGDIRPDDIAHFHADLVAGKA